MDTLTQLATSIRLKLGEEGMVIWYDSVTIKVVFLFTFGGVSLLERKLSWVDPKRHIMH